MWFVGLAFYLWRGWRASLPRAELAFFWVKSTGLVQKIALSEVSKKMFDFDATLPFMALQFIVLAFLLNAIFYKPLNKVLDERADYIRNNQEDAKQRLAKAKELTQEYEKQIADARRQSQEVIAAAQMDAKRIAAEKVAEAQREAQRQKEAAAQEIEQQRLSALSSLEQQVDGLSRQILEKLLGPELVR